MDRTYTVCFSGTSCTRDEGEESRSDSDKRIYSKETGYIPVRIHMEISGDRLEATNPSVIVRGVGANDWGNVDISEALTLNAPLKIPPGLKEATEQYSRGDRRSDIGVNMDTAIGRTSAAALALHGANLAAASDATAYNFIGHSRGAVECMMAAWFLYAYGGAKKDVPVRIFAIDPVPGPGTWYSIMTKLAPNVTNYVGITAWDHIGESLDRLFDPGLVPKPNAKMARISTAEPDVRKLNKLGWKDLADSYLSGRANPLEPAKIAGTPQPDGYRLFACRGRHATVAGNTTRDGKYDPTNADTSVARVPHLVYKMARAYLTDWGTVFSREPAVDLGALELRQRINLDHGAFDKMGGGSRRDKVVFGDLRTAISGRDGDVRYVSSAYGRNPMNKKYLEDVAGDPSYRQPYPVTAKRTGAGWVHWTYL
ncbi:Tat pathway signal protein [Streptomyces olivoreticuli]|uniref:Tat pathway signal protein n=1 Tax=Streptomyces olivoreticuli TaxID=68246 RepID=UPI000E2407FE|nr:Tat pathway signal protein [Streptomyces olivoreticuli]